MSRLQLNTTIYDNKRIMEFSLDQILAMTSLLLAFLFTLSEILGWSQCEANSLTQFLLGKCTGNQEDNDVGLPQ